MRYFGSFEPAVDRQYKEDDKDYNTKKQDQSNKGFLLAQKSELLFAYKY